MGKSLKDVIDSYRDDIIVLHKEGKKKSKIAQILIKRHNLVIDVGQVDSFRRGVSRLIKEVNDTSLIKDLNSPITFSEEILSKFNEYDKSDKLDHLINNLNSQGVEVGDEDEDEDDERKFVAQLKGATEHGEKVWFVDAADAYYFNIPGYPSPMRFTGTFIRELKNMYSTLGRTGGLTINQICRTVSLPRDVIIKIKTYMGWTHDSDPFTNEEMLQGDINDMVDRTLEDRKLIWFQKYTKKEQLLLTEAANKWWQFKGRTVNPFVEKMLEEHEGYMARKVDKYPRIEDKIGYALVIGPFDLHYGKNAWEGDTGSTYNRGLARELLLRSTAEIITEVKEKNIERVIIPIGSDFFHVDTMGGTTTRGTPQDCDGQVIQIMVEGNQLMIEFIDMLRKVADVELIMAAGNHDYVLSHQLLEVLAAYYRECSDVTVKRTYTFRQYTTFGNALLGFTHGDETKLSELPMLMATDAKVEWGTAVHKAFFTGHLHHEMSKDYNGVKVYQMPSLSGTDRWHHKKGYTASVKGLGAYLVHPTKGIRITVMENVD